MLSLGSKLACLFSIPLSACFGVRPAFHSRPCPHEDISNSGYFTHEKIGVERSGFLIFVDLSRLTTTSLHTVARITIGNRAEEKF